jgi:hypothetical protein
VQPDSAALVPAELEETHMRRIITVGLALLLAPALGRADAVLDWNVTMLGTISGQNPFAQARFAAITQLAVFEAVNAITGDYEPYLGTVTAPGGASAEAAAAAAAHGVLRTYFPGSAAALDAARASSLAAIPDGPAKEDGIAVGEAAAAAMVARRAGDGSAPPQFHVPGPPMAGEWQPTPACTPAGGALLHWAQVTPFGLDGPDQFRVGPPPALTSRRYARDYAEVMQAGGAGSTSRPPDRADVARFYAAVAAPGAWNAAARQVSAAQGRSLAENARAFALLNMAISDGLVATFDSKYHYDFWRPETAIRSGDADGNPRTHPDAAFAPLVTTPCFPSYPSAHAGASYAARRVAEALYGRRGHDITLTSAAVPGVTLHYGSFAQMTRDIDDARVYGGIHFRFDQDAGGRLGRRVGAYAYRNHLRPAHGADDRDCHEHRDVHDRREGRPERD